MSAASVSQKNRITGGRVDREQPLGFRFDGQHYTGFAGDTLASALLANNVRLVGRSFKYHRPRGMLTAPGWLNFKPFECCSCTVRR